MGQGQGGTTPSLLEVLAAATGLRIAIVDIDAHTGNGTQASVERPLPSPSFYLPVPAHHPVPPRLLTGPNPCDRSASRTRRACVDLRPSSAPGADVSFETHPIPASQGSA